MTTTTTDSWTDAGRVYREIKACVISYDFEQGKPIRVCQLAGQLGVSTTPVREALDMLAVKGLVTKTPKKVFIAMSQSDDRIVGLYGLNQVLLTTALLERALTATLPAGTAAAVTTLRNELNQGEPHSPEAIATHTGELFSCIAALARRTNAVESLDRVNDSLFYIRTLECQHLTDVPLELMLICELFLAEQFDELVKEISNYHEKRLVLLPRVMDLFSQ